jgi:2-amino-4-hydroxy-6-hydroxymethyldihydropteridine pyrophosphokinase
MPLAYLGLGSNVGDGVATLRSAFASLQGFLLDSRLSRLYRSAPMYLADQGDFINAVVCGECSLSPRELLAAVNAVEARFGRDRSRERFKGPRTLDIDILLYGELVLHEEDLVIPHAGLRERRFALEPLLELAPALRDPASGQPYAAVLASLPPQGIYLLE